MIDAPAWECDAVLSDGAAVHIRTISPDDGPRLVAFHSHLSPDTIYLRFFGAHPRLSPAEIERFTHVDGRGRVALVATLNEDIIGVARYDRSETDPREAEVAFVISDDHQGRGLGTLLLEQLAAHARAGGIGVFRAQTLPHNAPMLDVFRRAGFEHHAHYDQGVVDVHMDLTPTETLAAAIEERHRLAAVHSIERLLKPRSIAVIGAGEKTGTIGHEVFANLIAGRFCGPIYPVHPTAQTVAGVKAYPTITDVPDHIDLAVIAVPSNQVASVIEQCAEAGVQTAVVISAGFAEVDADGGRKQGQLVRQAHGGGMRVVGPNCMGVINTAADVQMNATFAPVAPTARSSRRSRRSPAGSGSLSSRKSPAAASGCPASFPWETRPTSAATISSNTGPRIPTPTSSSCTWSPSVTPAGSLQVARQASLQKPIVAVKAGRTASGQRAASSHTAALATPDAAVDALFAHTGVIRVDTLEDLLGVAQVVGSQPIPAGRRVAIVGNAGGPGILAADACESAGLQVAELSAATQAELRSFLPAAAGVTNPVDMVASASAEDYLQDAPPGAGRRRRRRGRRHLRATPRDRRRRRGPGHSHRRQRQPNPSWPASSGWRPHRRHSSPPRSPCRTFRSPSPPSVRWPTPVTYGEWRRRSPGNPVTFADIDIESGRRLIRAALDTRPQGGWLAAADAYRLLDTYRIGHPRGEMVATASEAAQAASAIGYPVALKAGAAELLHKTDKGAVRLGLKSGSEVEQAYAEMELGLGDEHGRGARTSHGRTRRRGHRRHSPRPHLRPAAHVRDRRHHRRAVRRPNSAGPAHHRH